MAYLLNQPRLLGLLLAISLAAVIELGRRTGAYAHIQGDANRKEQIVAIQFRNGKRPSHPQSQVQYWRLATKIAVVMPTSRS